VSAAHAVAFGGRSYFFGYSEADPHRSIVIANASLDDESRTCHPRRSGNGEKIRPLP